MGGRSAESKPQTDTAPPGQPPDESCIRQASNLSNLLIPKSLHVPDEVGPPACGRKKMQLFGDPVMRFDTLCILHGKIHELCHP